MKAIVLAVLAALSIGIAGVASAAGYSWDHNSTFPEGTLQVSPE